MTGTLPIGLGLAAATAATMNLGALYRHRGARAAPEVELRRPWRTARSLLARPSFAWGMALTALAAGLHVAALAFAPLSIVQVVLAAGLVLLAALAQLVFRMPTPRRHWAGVGLGACGLALLAVSLPPVHGPHSAYRPLTLAAFEAVLLLVCAALLAVPGHPSAHARRGALLGTAAGVIFGFSDVAIKAGTAILGGRSAPVATGMAIAVAVSSGVIGQYVAARSLQIGDAVPVLSLTALANNVANITGGIVVFSDPVPTGAAGVTIEMLAFVVICASTAVMPWRAESWEPV